MFLYKYILIAPSSLVCVSVHSESVFINRASELCQYESSEHCGDIHSLFTISLFLCMYKEEYLGVL